jgi:hypothetical protein
MVTVDSGELSRIPLSVRQQQPSLFSPKQVGVGKSNNLVTICQSCNNNHVEERAARQIEYLHGY